MIPQTNFTTVVSALLFFVLSTTGLSGISRGQSQQPTENSTRDTASSTIRNPKESEKERIESIIREYLLKNPSIIREAMQALQAQEARERAERSANLMKELRKEILFDPDSPIGGNASGDISIVVFFDYNCGYCKQTLPQIQSVLQSDTLVRIVFKELPILGPPSTFAAKAALAAARQGKYVEFHKALMMAERTDENAIRNISETLGMDYPKLEKDMADPQIAELIMRNLRLATSLDLNGTPAYIIGNQIIPGAIDAESLIRVVTIERNNAKNAIPEKSSQSNQ
jgi:protein-disulfide isomerase